MSTAAKKIIAHGPFKAREDYPTIKSPMHLAMAAQLAEHVSAHLDQLNAALETSRGSTKDSLLFHQEKALAIISSLGRIRGSFAPLIEENLRDSLDAVIAWRQSQLSPTKAQRVLTEKLQAALSDADSIDFFRTARTTRLAPAL